MKGRIKIPDVYKRECERYCDELVKERAKEVGNEEVRNMVIRNRNGINIITIWTARKFFGIGKKKLREFFDAFDRMFDECGGKYDYSDHDSIVFAMDQELQRIGVDVNKWMQEAKEQQEKGNQ